MSDSVPQWFTEALADPGELRWVEVHGVRVEYRVWGPQGAPVVVLIHGGAAHGGWWDHLAPSMAVRRRVAAVDLTGHGSSDTREQYSFLTWADEVVAVSTAEGSRRPHVIGHSMGGVVALVTAYRHHGRVAGTVAIDPPDWLVSEGGLTSRRVQLPPRRFHPSRELAAERFQARPPDSSRIDFVERHVARRSVHWTDGGWTWRFDPDVTMHDAFPDNLWGREHGPIALVLAERSLLTAKQADQLVDRLGTVDTLTIPDSGHHVMLDQPLALMACLEGLLAAWTSSSIDSRVEPVVSRPGS